MKQDYVDILKEDFASRKRKNSGYSERAYARDMNISSGYLSLIFNGKRKLSVSKAITIASRLGWSDIETGHFVGLVRREVEPNEGDDKGTHQRQPIEVKIDEFSLISDPKHAAILVVVQNNHVNSVREIARCLFFSLEDCSLAIERLSRMGLIHRKNGRFVASANDYEVKSVPSEAIRNFHRDSISRSLKELDLQPVGKRNFESILISLDIDKINDAKKFIDKFMREFDFKFGNKNEGEVYQLNLQLFSMAKRKEK